MTMMTMSMTMMMMAMMMMSMLLFAATAIASSSAAPEVKTPWGALQGVRLEGDGGRPMDAYLAIPYARPPVGELRYEKPQPHPGPGEGEVFVADRIMPACPQKPDLIGASREMSEDCLMLDIYVPLDDGTQAKPYAVMVFIHGGGLISGDTYTYRPSKMVADKQVIVVALQYRLGPLGFLTSRDDALPGNLGLWDQTLALRWVKDNVGAFGGDTGRITIFGESAGSWSVGFHLLMPHSQGLFQRAIMQSGSPLNSVQWTDGLGGKGKVFKDVTDMVGCEGENNQERLRCLKEVPLKLLMNKTADYDKKSPMFSHYFPVVDGDLIPRDPREMLREGGRGVGEVEVMVGVVQQEGGMVLIISMLGHASMDSIHTADFFRELLQACLFLNGLSNHTVLTQVTEFFYRGSEWQQEKSSSVVPVADMFGDCLMNADVVEYMRLLTAAPHTAPRYLYVLDHEFSFNSDTPLPGSHHGDDLTLLFDQEREWPDDFIFKLLKKDTFTPREDELSLKMVDLWTDFAKTGNPNGPLKKDLQGGEWPPFTEEGEQYLSLSGASKVVTHLGPYRDRMALWISLLPHLNSQIAQGKGKEGGEKDDGTAAAREEL